MSKQPNATVQPFTAKVVSSFKVLGVEYYEFETGEVCKRTPENIGKIMRNIKPPTVKFKTHAYEVVR